MKAQSKTIGMAIGVVLIIAIFTGVVLSSRGQAISSEISGNSEGGAALSLANTEDTEIIINELTSEIPETVEMSRNVQSGNTQNLKSSAAPVRLPAAPAPTPGTSQAAAQAGCVYRP